MEAARSTSAAAAGWRLTRIQAVEQPATHVFPRDRLDAPGLNVGDTAFDLVAPRRFDVWIRVCLERLDQKARKCRPIALGQFGSVAAQRGDTPGHGFSLLPRWFGRIES